MAIVPELHDFVTCGSGTSSFSAPRKISQTEAGLPGDFAVGALSYPRGVFRYFKQERRRLGYLGQGQQVQAILEDRLLLEIFGEILERPQFAGRLGLEAAKNRPGRVVGRFAAAQVATRLLQRKLGRLTGTAAGASFTVLAVGGDIETAVQVLSSQLQISAWTVDPRRPILPQLAGEDVDLLIDSVADIIESAILGDPQ